MGLFMGLMIIGGKHGPIDNEWVRFSSKHIDYPTKFHSWTFFYIIETYVGLTFEILTFVVKLVLSFPSLSTNLLQHVFLVEIANSLRIEC